MALLTKNDLQYTYSWTAYSGDDPKVTGSPDNTLLNRNEGYEVLYFINKLAELWDFKEKVSGKHIENMIHKKLPSNIRSQAKVKQWILDHWNDK